MSADSLLGMNFDEYRIEKPLGAGGMAKVYRALDVKLKRYVALKVITPDFRNDSNYAARFEREAQSIARLEHPNIVQIYRFGEANGMYYMAMQYIDGADLGSLIRDYKQDGEVMPIGDVLRVISDICAALDYAHVRDVIHRDVKPSNIMVDSLGRALLTDFGLALLGDVGTRGEVFGSPHYVAPEQTVSSANVVPQSDIYSLGITLFEMLTGELPFTGGEVIELTMRHISEKPPAPSQFNSAIPSEVDDVVLRALEKDPFDRYQTCAEMSAALQTAVESFRSVPALMDTPLRRPSLVLLPQKVHNHLQTPSTTTRDVAPALSSTSFPVSEPPQTIRNASANRSSANSWARAAIFAGVVFLLGIVFIFVLLKSQSQSNPQRELIPTSAPTETSLAAQVVTVSTPSAPPSAMPVTLVLTQPPPLNPTTIPVTFVPASVEPTAVGLVPTTAPKQYALLIARHADQSLYILNLGLNPFPLTGLRIGNAQGEIVGAQWQVSEVNNGECVTLWSSAPNASAPDIVCSEVGTRLTRNPPDVFWKTPFMVYYNELPVATCAQDTCVVRIVLD